MLILERFQATDAAADNDAEALAIDLLQIEAAVGHRHFCRRHRELSETIGAAWVLRVLEKIFRLEVADFGRDLAIVPFGIEGLDSLDSADAIEAIAPEAVDVIADRRDSAEACENDSAIGVHWVFSAFPSRRSGRSEKVCPRF